MPAVNNSDGFFNNLPIQSEKKRGCKKLRMTKQEKKEWQILQLKARQQQMNDRLAKAEKELIDMNKSSSSEDEEQKQPNSHHNQPPAPVPSQSPLMARQQISTNNNAEEQQPNALEMGGSDPPNNRDTSLPGQQNEEMQDEQEDPNQAFDQQNMAHPGTGKSSVNRRQKKNVPLDPSAIASSVKRNHAARNAQNDINQIAGFMQGMQLDKNLTNMR